MKMFTMYLFIILSILITAPCVNASKITSMTVLDQDYLMITFIEGEVKFKDDGTGPSAFASHTSDPSDNWIEEYGVLDVDAVADTANWTITSKNDNSYAGNGKSPVKVFRKSKINGMAQYEWDLTKNDYRYETTLGHTVYLKLPSPLKNGGQYALKIGKKVDPKGSNIDFVFNIFESQSEAIHMNLVGFSDAPTIKTLDIFQWLGNGGAREYKSFEGAKVFIYDIKTKTSTEVGKVMYWKEQGKDVGNYNSTRSDVWIADFSSFNTPGTYRIAIEGIGCSKDFTIEKNIYEQPFKVSLKGFYYMRIGEAPRNDIKPIPRQPQYIPGKSPPDTKVVLTTMHPYHPDWKTFAEGDPWDKPDSWQPYTKKGSVNNPKAIGGHSDALDWDRHLGHVSIIYDMLYPFLLTRGAINDDDVGIPESGNGVPDILDEAQNEVDFWLNLRDGQGYSHGLTNPNKGNTLYQAGPTAIAAWANAANAAMLAECYRIAGLEELKNRYLNHALKAYEYAENYDDQQLEMSQDVGETIMQGKDFKMTAAAFLFNLTGEPKYESVLEEYTVAVDDEADVIQKKNCQIWATAGYLLTPQKVGNKELYDRLKTCVVNQALKKEVDRSADRPSRRITDDVGGYFYPSQNVHRTLLAHRITKDPALKRKLLNGLILEADWGLGRNPLNMILMTTATTPLAVHRSVENIYTSGRNDGTPGLHPGHTPYLNTDDWWQVMIMGKPSWMGDQSFPPMKEWPRGECYYNTRYVWAHSEFTPQQTMRGKMALYGYLYGIDKSRKTQK